LNSLIEEYFRQVPRIPPERASVLLPGRDSTGAGMGMVRPPGAGLRERVEVPEKHDFLAPPERSAMERALQGANFSTNILSKKCRNFGDGYKSGIFFHTPCGCPDQRLGGEQDYEAVKIERGFFRRLQDLIRTGNWVVIEMLPIDKSKSLEVRKETGKMNASPL
jgi:hypothetical protein